jgi:hypothetical protein
MVGSSSRESTTTMEIDGWADKEFTLQLLVNFQIGSLTPDVGRQAPIPAKMLHPPLSSLSNPFLP